MTLYRRDGLSSKTAIVDIARVTENGLPYIRVDIICKRLTPDDADVLADELKRMAADNRQSILAKIYEDQK